MHNIFVYMYMNKKTYEDNSHILYIRIYNTVYEYHQGTQWNDYHHIFSSLILFPKPKSTKTWLQAARFQGQKQAPCMTVYDETRVSPSNSYKVGPGSNYKWSYGAL